MGFQKNYKTNYKKYFYFQKILEKFLKNLSYWNKMLRAIHAPKYISHHGTCTSLSLSQVGLCETCLSHLLNLFSKIESSQLGSWLVKFQPFLTKFLAIFFMFFTRFNHSKPNVIFNLIFYWWKHEIQTQLKNASHSYE